MLGPSVRTLGEKCISKFRVVAGAGKAEYFNHVIRTEIEELLSAPSEFRRAGRRQLGSAEDETLLDTDSLSWY